ASSPPESFEGKGALSSESASLSCPWLTRISASRRRNLQFHSSFSPEKRLRAAFASLREVSRSPRMKACRAWSNVFCGSGSRLQLTCVRSDKDAAKTSSSNFWLLACDTAPPRCLLQTLERSQPNFKARSPSG